MGTLRKRTPHQDKGQSSWSPRTAPQEQGPQCALSPLQAVINTMCGHGMQARGYLEASAFIHTNGCIDKLVNWTHSNLFLLGGITLGLALPQVRGTRLCPKALLSGVCGELP